MRVFGIGNPLIDLIYQVSDQDLAILGLDRGIMHLVDDERRDAILRHLDGREVMHAPGGDVPNTMINLRLMGVETVLAGKTGNDEFGRLYEERLTACGVESALRHGPGKTGSSIILVSPDGERTMNTYLGMCREFGAEDIDRPVLFGTDLLYFTGYMWDTEKQKEAINAAIALAEARDQIAVFDVADPFAVTRYREDFLWLLERHIDVVFANAEEARIMVDSDDPVTCAHRLGALTTIAVVKDGARGSHVCYKGQCVSVPAYPATMLDSTGAGDTYASGFLLGLARAFGQGLVNLDTLSHEQVQECALLAGYLAARVISRKGAQLTPPDAPELLQGIAQGQHRLPVRPA